MKRFKSILAVAIVCVALLGLMPLGGCDATTPAQRVAVVQSTVNQANALSQQANVSVEQVKVVIQSCQLMLSDPNIPAETKAQLQMTLATAQTKLDKLMVEKTKLDQVLANAQAILNSVDLNNMDAQKEVQVYGQAISTVAPMLPPPYGVYLSLATAFGIPLIGLIATWLKQRQTSSQLDDTKYALTDVVTSVKALLDPTNGVIPVDKVKDAKAVLVKNQDGFTQDKVDAILDPMVNTGPSNL